MTFYRDLRDNVCYSPRGNSNLYGFGGLSSYRDPDRFGNPYGYYRDLYRSESPYGYRSFGSLYGNRGLSGYGDCYGYGYLQSYGYSYPFSSHFGNRYSYGNCYPC